MSKGLGFVGVGLVVIVVGWLLWRWNQRKAWDPVGPNRAGLLMGGGAFFALLGAALVLLDWAGVR